MNHSFEKESTRAVPAIEYRKVFKRFERTDAKREHIRRGRKDSPSEAGASGIPGFYNMLLLIDALKSAGISDSRLKDLTYNNCAKLLLGMKSN